MASTPLPGHAPVPLVPRFGYVGGSKGRLARRIVSLFPETGERFVEPFAGRANVYFAVTQFCHYKKIWLNDIRTYKFLEALRSGKSVIPNREIDDQLYRRMKTSKVNRGLDTLEKSADVSINLHLLESLLSWSGGFFEDAGPKRRGFKGPSLWGFLLQCIRAFAIMEVSKPRITHLDYRRVLAQCRENDLVYL
jgi:site-specific DNA-adenine methylase